MHTGRTYNPRPMSWVLSARFETTGTNMRRIIFSCCLVVALCPVGCSRKVQKPSLFNPGPANYQRQNATVHDPYPLNDVGPPIVGGRPRDFQVPADEVTRARQYAPWGAR